MVARSDNPYRIRLESHRYIYLRARLTEAIADLDEETLADTLDGLSDLKEMLAAVVRSALDDEALVVGLATRLDDMKTRLERIKSRAQRKRQVVRDAMITAELQNFQEADFAVSLRKAPPSVEITAERDVPAAFLKPQPPKVDKIGILAALKAGTEVAGAQLSPPRTQLSVRST